MNENARKWVAALRSGEFKQGRGHLRSGNGFSVLGVACDLFRRETGLGSWSGCGFLLWPARSVCVIASLPEEVRTWLGLRDRHGAFAGARLSDLSDEGVPFSSLADLIESQPLGLFAQNERTLAAQEEEA